jgi:drug/metabolite transporter (DMT)-like permease
MRTQVKADLMLVLVTLCWGVSYLMMDICLEEMGVFNLNAFRFLLAFFVALVIAFPKLKNALYQKDQPHLYLDIYLLKLA